MDRNFMDEVIEEARQFTEKEIRPFAGDFEQNEQVPRELINKMAKRKYLAAPFPEEYGGLGLDPLYYGYLTEEIGKGCASTRALMTVHTSLVGETLLKWGTKEQKERYLRPMASGEKIAAFALSEPEVGTDAGSVKTSYIKEGNKYILNGKKKWITFGNLADIFIIIASEGKNISAFIAERDFGGITTKPIKGMMAGRAAYIAEIEINNLEIPEENLLGKIGGGFTFICNTALDYGRYSVAWAATAVAGAAVEEMVTYARHRTQFDQKIYKFQTIREIIANATTKYLTSKALCINAGNLRIQGSDEKVFQTTLAKYYSSKIAMEVTTDAIQVFGGNGCTSEYPVERLFREAKIFEIIEGTSQIQQEIISRYALSNFYRKKAKAQ
ncbi:MAG: acyl-CoA dehydrogenase family protein [Bacillota bacterium]|nr:acyl-CoA dehydrogenase family protein [Bacillota bacterium]